MGRGGCEFKKYLFPQGRKKQIFLEPPVSAALPQTCRPAACSRPPRRSAVHPRNVQTRQSPGPQDRKKIKEPVHSKGQRNVMPFCDKKSM